MTEELEDITALKKHIRLRGEARAARVDARYLLIARCISFLVIVVGVMDAVSTNAGLAAGGFEANPLVRYIMHHFGEMWIGPKLFVHVWLAFMILWFPNKPTFIMMMCTTLLTMYAVVGNLAIAFS